LNEIHFLILLRTREVQMTETELERTVDAHSVGAILDACATSAAQKASAFS
jgi:hypothetical protein